MTRTGTSTTEPAGRPGDRHVAALRQLFHLMLGKLHHCLQHNTVYDPTKAFTELAAAAA